MTGPRGCQTIGGRVVAGLAAAALIVLLPVTLLARNIALVLFRPEALTQAVSERLIDSGLLRETIVGNLLGGRTDPGVVSLDSATQYLTPDERARMIDLLIPETWVRDQILQVTTQFLAWFDEPSTSLVLTLDTGAVANGLEGEPAALVVEMVVESWPSCTLEDVGKMIGIGAMPGEQGFPFCEPPEPLRGVVVGALTETFRQFGGSLPARIAIVDRAFQDGNRLMQAKERVRMLRFFGTWGILVSLALLGVITAAAVRSWKALTRWWGIPLLLGGLLALAPVLTGGHLLRLLISRLTAGLGGLPALTELAHALAEAVGKAVLRPQTWQALLITVMGSFLLLLSFIGRRSPRAASPKPPETMATGISGLETPGETEGPRTRPSGMFG
jgi:hypothetical protein